MDPTIKDIIVSPFRCGHRITKVVQLPPIYRRGKEGKCFYGLKFEQPTYQKLTKSQQPTQHQASSQYNSKQPSNIEDINQPTEHEDNQPTEQQSSNQQRGEQEANIQAINQPTKFEHQVNKLHFKPNNGQKIDQRARDHQWHPNSSLYIGLFGC